MKREQTLALLAAIEAAGYDAQDYSGRAMFGASCLAYTVESSEHLQSVAAVTAHFIAATDDSQNPDEAIELFEGVRWDTMGRSGIVVYFPDAHWTPEDHERHLDGGQEPEKGTTYRGKVKDCGAVTITVEGEDPRPFVLFPQRGHDIPADIQVGEEVVGTYTRKSPSMSLWVWKRKEV